VNSLDGGVAAEATFGPTLPPASPQVEGCIKESDAKHLLRATTGCSAPGEYTVTINTCLWDDAPVWLLATLRIVPWMRRTHPHMVTRLHTKRYAPTSRARDRPETVFAKRGNMAPQCGFVGRGTCLSRACSERKGERQGIPAHTALARRGRKPTKLSTR